MYRVLYNTRVLSNGVKLASNKCGQHMPAACYSNKLDSLFEDPGFPRVGLTKDRRTVAMFHPPVETPYEKTIAIPRLDKRYSAYESANDIVLEKLQNIGVADCTVENNRPEHFFPLDDKEIPGTAHELGKMFYTTYHSWFRSRRFKPRRFAEYKDKQNRPTR